MKLSYKIYVAIALALIVGSLFFVARARMEGLLETHARVLHNISELEWLDEELNGAVWKTAFMLYNDYDSVNNLMNNARDMLAEIRQNRLLESSHYEAMRTQLQRYAEMLDEKEADIQSFATLNSLIKNSTVHLPLLNSRYMNMFGRQDDAYIHELHQVTTTLFLASNSLDLDFLDGLKEALVKLEAREFTDPQRAEFNRVFVAHAQVFSRYMPEYLAAFYKVLDSGTSDMLHWTYESFVAASGAEADRVASLSLVITFAFVVSIGVIVYYLIRVERKHEETVSLHQDLRRAATTDQLTGLGNRFRFDLDRRARNVMDKGLIMVNVDGFKNVNDFFGHEAGDAVLVRLGAVLSEVLGQEAAHILYRLGADDFGILGDYGEQADCHRLAERVINAVERARFDYQGTAIPISVSLGISCHQPLLETADMALKRVKRSRKKYLEYSPDHDIQDRVKGNLQVLHRLREAIQHDRVVAHYMPMLNLATGLVDRYECLMRVNTDAGVMYPNDFLDVAKESRLYGELTRIMIRKAFNTFRANQYGFAINLSIEDIMDRTVTGFLFEALDNAPPDLGRRLTLELLESEEVGNYEAVQSFVKAAKGYGCRIAIDDFGSGYSNLKHLLNLDVDNLKIDASLIRDIDTNPLSRATVGAIIRLARELNIPTVTAEFVHSEAVRGAVQEMGIDYAQGFFIGRPAPGLSHADVRMVG